MTSLGEDDEGRLEVAEEAVRIVRRFNTAKDKDDRQRKIIELCTDIAGILDAKRRLEGLVKKQNAELDELRQRIRSANTTSTSGRGSLTPDSTDGSNPQVSSTPSSGRGTALCHRGTDPLYEWPERPSTCTRSTSPLLFPVSSMTSLVESRESLTNPELGVENDDTLTDHAEKPGKEDEYHLGDDTKTDVDESQRRNKESDDKLKDNEAEAKKEAEDKDGDRKNEESALKQKSTSTKTSPQTSKRTGKGVVTSSKNKERKRAPAAPDHSPRKSAGQKSDFKPKEKNFETLWKNNQLNLFNGSQSSAKERKNNARNRAKDKTSAGSKSKGTRLSSSNRNAADKHQSESSSSSFESEEDEELTRKVNPELTSEYWDIHKLIRFLKVGNPTATVIVLCALRDVGLEQESNQLAILEMGGISILLNILKTDHWRCVIGSLKILRVITNTKRINMEIYRLGGIQQLIDCLQNNLKEVQSLAAETLSHIVTFRLAYNAVRRGGGIKQLVNIIQPGNKRRNKTAPKDEDGFQLAHNTCMALWSCSRSPKNIQAIRAAGALPILASLLVKEQDDVILPTMGIIQECATEPAFREDIRREGMVETIVKYLKTGDVPLKTLCATALFKCAEDDATREIISRHGGLELLVQLMTSRTFEKQLLAATVGALWKCSLNKNNVKRLEQFGAVKALILLIKTADQPHEVLANTLGALHEFAHSRRTVLTLRDEKVIPVVVRALTITENPVLINATRLLAVCAKEQMCRSTILSTDGLRLLWSLLKFPDPKVVAGAAEAISECVADEAESADAVRSFVGGLELITNLLRSDDKQVLISISKAIVNIGKDRENLSILTDYEVVTLLIDLVNTEDEELKRWVAEAIATCSGLEKNVKSFSPAVVPLADSLKHSSDVAVKRAIACALEKLSRDPYNCYLIHQHDALKTLLVLTGSVDERVQEAAAACIKNMRVNAMNMLAR